MRTSYILAALVIVGCTTDFEDGDEDTSTTTDMGIDTQADTAPADTVIPDTHVDTTVPDTPADTTPDVVTDSGPDTAVDTYVDTSVDPDPDTALDSLVDPGVDTAPDPGTDPGCVSETAALGGVCDIMAQCGCPSGHYCTYYTDFAFCTAWEVCEPGSGGTADVGEECDFTEAGDCMPGLTCVYDGPTAHCYKWCLTDADCPVPMACSISLVTSGCDPGPFTHLVCN